MIRQATACFLLALLALSIFCIATDAPDYRAGSLSRLEPQAIYSADPHDPWNRIFFLLFSRSVEMRLTEDFKGDGPYESVAVMGNPALRVTTRTFQRIESGDRAIDPLYPNFFNAQGAESVLLDPEFTELKQALTEACAETVVRSRLHRALMQSDVWAAYDTLSWSRTTHGPLGDHARELLPLLARFIGKLALSSKEIAALPRNYHYSAAQDPAGQRRLNLPDVFHEGSGWMEVEWFPTRMHDEAAGNRRAVRVFLKPGTDPQKFLAEVNERIRKHEDPLPDGTRTLEGAALATQLLLIDRSGRVVPSPLIYEMQVRTTLKDAQGNFKATAVEEYDLSRKLLLTDSSAVGFVRHGPDDPAYLPSSGNDFTFASPTIGQKEAGPAILGNLRRRCESCHFETSVHTFEFIQMPGRRSPPVRQLRADGDQHAEYVADRKMKDGRFKTLRAEK